MAEGDAIISVTSVTSVTESSFTKDPSNIPSSETSHDAVLAHSPAAENDEAPAGRRPSKRPAARGSAFYPRKRANTACQVCRARKTKCDNLKPSCTYCLSVGANCIQSPVDLSSFDPASLKILQRLDELETVIRSLPSCAAPESPAAPYQGRRPGPHQDPRIHSPTSLTLPPIAKPQASPAEPLDDGPEINSILPQRVDHILTWPAFLDFQHRPSPPVPGRESLDAMAIFPDGSATLATACNLESARMYQLLDDFFLHIHCKNPILDEATTREMVLDAFHHGIDWSPASCLAMIICALGCIATPFGPSDHTKVGTPAYRESQVFFHEAQKRIGTLLVRSDIVGAQCLFLSGIYLMMTFQPIFAWRFFSQTLASCQHFPFLAKAQSSCSSPATSTMGPKDTQEQAVYWSAWKSERELHQELDLPDFVLNRGDTLYPPFFPAPPSQPANLPDVPGSEAERAYSSWMFYLAEISLRRLTNRLSSELMSLRGRSLSNSLFLSVLSDMTPEFEAQVSAWSDNLPQDLCLTSPIDEDGISRSVLRGRMINLLETIYWPFVMAYISSCSTGRGMSMSMSAKVKDLAGVGLETHIYQIRVNRPGFHHRHHGGFFMIRSCTRSALVLLAAAAAGCLMPRGWDAAVPEVVSMLAYWEDEDADVPRWRATLERALASWQTSRLLE